MDMSNSPDENKKPFSDFTAQDWADYAAKRAAEANYSSTDLSACGDLFSSVAAAAASSFFASRSSRANDSAYKNAKAYAAEAAYYADKSEKATDDTGSPDKKELNDKKK